MGLDIKAYQGLKLIGTARDGEDYERQFNWKTTFYAHPCYISGSEYPKQLEGSALIAGGVYEYADSTSFKAGSYSGYNWWRDELSRMAIKVPAEIVWKNWNLYLNQPFYLLVNFSDCEGIIAGSAVNKLKQDFEEWQEQANTHEHRSFRELYALWRKAFEMATDGGVVYFY